MAATHPLDTICKLLDLSPRRVQQLSKEGIIPKAERGRYELVPAVRGYIHYLKERSVTGDVKEGDNIVSFDEARRRKLTAEAELAELDLSKEQGSVVSIEQTEKMWTGVLAAVRAKFLSLPTNLSSIVATEADQKICKDILSKGVEAALTELSQIEIRPETEDSSSGDKIAKEDGTTTEGDRKPVGRRKKKAKS